MQQTGSKPSSSTHTLIDPSSRVCIVSAMLEARPGFKAGGWIAPHAPPVFPQPRFCIAGSPARRYLSSSPLLRLKDFVVEFFGG